MQFCMSAQYAAETNHQIGYNAETRKNADEAFIKTQMVLESMCVCVCVGLETIEKSLLGCQWILNY